MPATIIRVTAPETERTPAGFHVRAYGIAENMSPGWVDCHRVLPDWLCIHFHGPAWFYAHDTPRPLAEGALVCWAPRETACYGNPRQAWTHSWLHLRGAGVGRLLRAHGIRPGHPLTSPDPWGTERFLEAVHEEYSLEPQPDPRLLRNLAENWLIRLQRSAGYSPRAPAALLAVKRRLELQPGEALSLTMMARLAGMSLSHFCAEFRRHFGLPPRRFQTQCRIQQARYLLETRGDRVAEVAAALGYSDPFVFSKAFRRETGSSPRDCIRR